MPCSAQKIILRERRDLLRQAEPLVQDLEIAVANNSDAILQIGSKSWTMKELLGEVKNMTPIGMRHITSWLRAQGRIEK